MSQKKAGLLLVLAASLCSLAVMDRFVFAKEKERDGCRQRAFGKFSDWSEPVNLGPVAPADTIVSYCGGDWGVISGDETCTFQCFAGDYLRVRGHASDEFGFNPHVIVTASCGGVTVQCADGGGSPGCEVISNDVVQQDDEQGLCTAVGRVWGTYNCADIVLATPRSSTTKPAASTTRAAPLRWP